MNIEYSFPKYILLTPGSSATAEGGPHYGAITTSTRGCSSEYPLGQAIVAGAAERGVLLAEPADFQSITGKGIQVTVEGRQMLVGNQRLLADASIDTEEMERRAAELADEAEVVS